MSNLKSHIWNRTVLGLLAVAAMGLALAYQTRLPITLEMSSDRESTYLAGGFYSPEEVFGVTYRWTDGDALMRFPGLGSGVPLRLTANLHAFRPPPLTPLPATILLNGHRAARLPVTIELATYQIDLPAGLVNLRGDVVLGLKSDSFVPKQTMNTNDERTLGLFVDRVELNYGPGLILPPLIVWALLLISVMALYAFAQVIGLGKPYCFGIGLVLLVAEIVGVIVARAFQHFIKNLQQFLNSGRSQLVPSRQKQWWRNVV